MVPRLLCVGLFQKSAPELILPERFGEDQLIVARGEAVVDQHVGPFAIPPELRTARAEHFEIVEPVTGHVKVKSLTVFTA